MYVGDKMLLISEEWWAQRNGMVLNQNLCHWTFFSLKKGSSSKYGILQTFVYFQHRYITVTLIYIHLYVNVYNKNNKNIIKYNWLYEGKEFY